MTREKQRRGERERESAREDKAKRSQETERESTIVFRRSRLSAEFEAFLIFPILDYRTRKMATGVIRMEVVMNLW